MKAITNKQITLIGAVFENLPNGNMVEVHIGFHWAVAVVDF